MRIDQTGFRFITGFSKLSIIVVPVMLLALASAVTAQDSINTAYKHYHSGNHKAAVQILSKAVKGKHRSNPKAHYYLGNAWMKLGRPDYAKQCYRRSLNLKPGQPLASYCVSAIRSAGGSKRTGGKGIIAIGFRDNEIVKVHEGGSAHRAGLKPGDRINAIDGKSTYGLNTNAVAKLLSSGPPGSRVALTLNRNGKILKTSVVRQTPSNPDGNGYKRIGSNKVQKVEKKVELSQLDKSLIVIHKDKKTKNTDYVYNEVAEALSYLSDKTKNVLRSGGCKILIAPTILHACPELRNTKPGAYLHGGNYNNCPGLFMPSRKTLYIAETASWRNSPPQLNRWAVRTALHELGHAYDFCRGHLSNKAAFKQASKKDHQKLTNTTRQTYWYYTQESRGDAELFAELFSVIHGRGGLDSKAANMPGVFPNCTKYLRNLITN